MNIGNAASRGNLRTASPPAAGAAIRSLALLLALALAPLIQGQSAETSPASLSLQEGESATLRIRYTSRPGGFNLYSTLHIGTPKGVSTSHRHLSIRSNLWNNYHDITITAVQDADHLNESGRISIRHLVNGAILGEAVGVSVTVADDDQPSIVLAGAPVSVDEGGSSTFSVRLSKAPHTFRAIALSSDNPAVTVSPASLGFSSLGWNTPHTVTVTAAEDADMDNGSATVSLSNTAIKDSSLEVEVVDNDVPEIGLTLSPSSLELTEGGSDTFTVQLAGRPNGRKTIALASDNTDIKVSPASLSFTTSNWSAAQSVTVRTAEDARDDDETGQISLTGVRITSGTVDVSVRDNDFTGHLSVTPSVIEIIEGQKITASSQLASPLTVSVDHEPTLDSLSLMLGDPAGSAGLRVGSGDAGISMQYRRGSTGTAAKGTPVPFSATDFIEALEDDNSEDETYTIPITVQATGGDYGGFEGATAGITVRVLDNDAVVLAPSTASLTLDEAETGTFTVRLRKRPSAGAAITLTSSNPDVSVSPATLNFTTTNWNTDQTVTVSAVRDGDRADDLSHINFSGANVRDASLSVTVREIVNITLDSASMTVSEGGSGTLRVRLAGQPHSDTTLTLTSDNADVNFAPTTLDFTQDNRNTYQTVTISVAEDADFADETAKISLSGAAVADAEVLVSVTDNDVIGLTFSPVRHIQVTEGGDAQSFTVQLASRPNSSRVISLSSDNADIALSTASLGFTTENWDTPQTVTATALDDADKSDESAHISLIGDGIRTGSMLVSLTDNDIGYTLSSTSLRIDEGESRTFDIRLDAQPLSGRRIQLASDNDDVRLSTKELSFHSTNWQVNQTITVHTAEDDDAAPDSATITLSGNGMVTRKIGVSVIDDDSLDIAVTGAPLALNEGGSGRLMVSLTAAPLQTTTVTPSSDYAGVTFSPATLDFTTTDWGSPQTLTVSAREDADAGDEKAEISLAAPGIDSVTAKVSVDDDEALSIDVTGVTGGSLALAEGASGTFSVKLNLDPDVDTTVALASDNDDIRISPAALSFTAGAAGNWGAAQSVTVRSLQDLDAIDDSGQIRITAPGATPNSVGVSVDDDEDQGIHVATHSLSIDEGGSATLNVRLTAAPAGSATVTLASDNPDVTLSATTLSFTAANWQTDRPVAVSAAQDTDAADASATISLTAPGLAPAEVAVTVDDDETAGLLLSEDYLELHELDTDSFTVALSIRPTVDVSVALNRDNPDINLSPAHLSFTPANWRTPQTVTITALDDTDAISPGILNVTASAFGGSFEGVSGNVRVHVIDDDNEGIILFSVRPLRLDEGTSDTFEVILNSRPTGAVTLMLGLSSSDTDVVLDTDASKEGAQNTLSFDASNWRDRQTVTVTDGGDDDAADDLAVIRVTASGADYGDITEELSVWVADDDTPGIVLTGIPSGGIALNEGESTTFRVRLRTRPSGEVLINPGFSLSKYSVLTYTDPDITAPQNLLSFTPDNWSIEQTVTVIAESDANALSESVNLEVQSFGADYSNIREYVAVRVTDSQTPGIVLAGIGSAGLALEEGRTESFSVRLGTEPSESVTLTVTSADATSVSPTADGSGAARTLRFTDTNWNTPQSVQLTGVQDEDGEGEGVTVTVTTAGGEYDAVSESFRVAVTDDDTHALQERESDAAALALAEIVSAVLPATRDTIALRFGAPRDARSASVAGRRIALDRSLARDLAAGFAGRAGVRGAGRDGRFAGDRFGAERHSADWLGGVPLEDGRPLQLAEGGPSSSGRGALLDGFSYALSPLSPAAGEGGWSVWGRIDSGEFSGTSDGVEFDGSQGNVWLGFDRRSEAGILSGLAFSSTGADADYTLGKFGAAIETSLSIVLPYVEISTEGGVSGHIMLGVVSGDATLTQTDQMQGTADLSMYLMSAGGSWPAAEFGSATLSWAGDISFSTLQTSGSELAALRDLSAGSMQIRGGVELVHSGFGESVTAAPRIALQLRHDAGDGITGTGVELSAGLRMLSASERLSVDLSARSLTTHSAEDLSDWGAGLQLRLHPKGGGGGLGFALGPTWGNTEDDDLLERDDAFGLDGADLQNRRRRAQRRGVAGSIGYGLRTLGGLLTPYSEYRYTGGEYGGARQVAGVKFADGERLDLRLFSERRVSARGETRSRLAVELQRRF